MLYQSLKSIRAIAALREDTLTHCLSDLHSVKSIFSIILVTLAKILLTNATAPRISHERISIFEREDI